jgi:hypothetical protein
MARRSALVAGALLMAAGVVVGWVASRRSQSAAGGALTACLAQLGAASAAVQAEEPGEDKLLDAMVGETWFRVYALGQPAGYAYLASQFDQEDGRRVFKTVNETLTVYHNPSFVPTRFLFTCDLFGKQQTVEATLQDGHLHVKSVTGGRGMESDLPVSDKFGSEVEITRAAVEGRLRPGLQFEFETFNPATSSLDQVTVTVGDIETVELPAGPVQARALQVHSSALGVTSTEWIAEPAEVVKLTFPVLGAQMVKVTEEEALQGYSPLKITESIPVRTPIPTVKQVRRLVVDVESAADAVTELVPQDARQRVVEETDGDATIEVRSIQPAPTQTAALPIQGGEVAEYLRPTEYVEPDDPAIAAAARQAVGDERNAWEAARRLVRWVYEAVEEKDRQPAPVTSTHVLATKSGDCTEHTVLFVALARAVGLPARFCAGIAMSGGAFYYHAWPEVYVGPAGWIAVDPTWDETVVDATHIKLGEGALDQQSFARICLAAGRAMGNLELTVREYELADGTVHRAQ